MPDEDGAALCARSILWCCPLCTLNSLEKVSGWLLATWCPGVAAPAAVGGAAAPAAAAAAVADSDDGCADGGWLVWLAVGLMSAPFPAALYWMLRTGGIAEASGTQAKRKAGADLARP